LRTSVGQDPDEILLASVRQVSASPFYADAESERRGAAKHRDRALAGLTGQVIEIGAAANYGRTPQQWVLWP
jgi:hypothetical protein